MPSSSRTLASEMSFGPPEQRRALALSAERLARQVGDAATLVRVLTLIEMPLQPEALGERLANTEEAVLLAQELGDPALVFWAAAHGHVDAGQAGELRAILPVPRHHAVAE